MYVAPYMGAWIEIRKSIVDLDIENYVAPYMGAWIEIKWGVNIRVSVKRSRPTWARGLK